MTDENNEELSPENEHNGQINSSSPWTSNPPASGTEVRRFSLAQRSSLNVSENEIEN